MGSGTCFDGLDDETLQQDRFCLPMISPDRPTRPARDAAGCHGWNGPRLLPRCCAAA
jgi:hypothetical protein